MHALFCIVKDMARRRSCVQSLLPAKATKSDMRRQERGEREREREREREMYNDLSYVRKHYKSWSEDSKKMYTRCAQLEQVS